MSHGPVSPSNYSQELDAACRLCAYANVAIALAETTARVALIDNSNNPLAIIR